MLGAVRDILRRSRRVRALRLLAEASPVLLVLAVIL